MLELGLCGLEPQPLGNLPEFRLRSGADDDGRCGAADDARPHPERVRASGERRISIQFACIFLRRKTFSGQRGFVNEEVFRFQQQTIAGNDIARVEDHDVARHDLLDVYLFARAVAQNPRIDLNDGQQLFHRIRCALLLPEAEQAAQADDANDDRSVNRLAQEKGENGRQNQDDDQRAFELRQLQDERVGPFLRLQGIAPVER